MLSFRWIRDGQQFAFAAIALLLVVAGSYFAQKIWRENGLRALQAVNEPRIQLVANAMKAEISRQDHLPVVLAFDPDVRAALAAPLDQALRDGLSDKLKRVGHEADTRALYILSPSGKVFAAYDDTSSETRTERDLSDRPYFRSAVKTGRGTYLGVDQSSERVRYYVAHAVGGTPVAGVAVVRVEFDRIEADWDKAGERVLVSDANGTVFLSSDAPFKYRRIKAALPNGTNEPQSGDSAYPENHSAPIDFKVVEYRGDGRIVQDRSR